MKTFLELLSEVERDTARQDKLWVGILKRRKRGPLAHLEKPGRTRNLIKRAPFPYDADAPLPVHTSSLQTVAHKDIVSDQDEVYKKGVRNKIRGRDRDEDHSSTAPMGIYNKKTGKIHVFDGNHRLNQDMIAGKKSTKMHVLKKANFLTQLAWKLGFGRQ